MSSNASAPPKEGIFIELDSPEHEASLRKVLESHFSVKGNLGGGLIVHEQTTKLSNDPPYERLALLIRQMNGISPVSIVPQAFADLPLLVAVRKAKQLRSLVPLHTDRDVMFSALRYMKPKLPTSNGEIDRLAEYAGGQTSLYFKFIRAYRNWLFLPALFAVVFTIYPDTFGLEAVDLAPAALAWASAFLSFGWQWIRRETKDARGVSTQLLGYHEDERTWSRVVRGIWSFLCFSIFLVISVSLLFTTLNSAELVPNAMVRTIIFTLVSQTVGALVEPVARKLTSWEHHGDDLAYEKSRIIKAVTLKLATFFPFPIHLAFTSENAVAAIQAHLATTFTTKQIVQGITEMAPWLRQRFVARKAPLEAWSGEVWTTNDEYLEMGIQFATLMAFGFLWPLSFALAFLNNVFEGILDAEKLSLCRRPFPSNIDLNKLWLRTFRVVTFVGASVNVGLLLKLGERSRQSIFTHYFAMIVLAVLAVRGFRDLSKLSMRVSKASKHD